MDDPFKHGALYDPRVMPARSAQDALYALRALFHEHRIAGPYREAARAAQRRTVKRP